MAKSESTPTISTVSVKNYRPVAALSDETEAFSASIYLDGKRAGRVTNSGTGGPNTYDFPDPAQYEAFQAYARAWAQDNDDVYEPDDGLIGQLCDDIEFRKRGRRWLAGGAVGLVLIHKGPRWFTKVPGEGKPHFYEESILVAVDKGETHAEVAAREHADAWRVVPTETA